ncbi:UNVERIFIED_CONTAM: hypothetical protein BEN50_00425 [Euhalothece sp. KZN 001]
MRLKDFHETFSNDLQDRQFASEYLQESLEEGGIILFLSALKDIIRVSQNNRVHFEKIEEENTILNNFLKRQNPTFLEVYQVLKILDLDLQVQRSSSASTIA